MNWWGIVVSFGFVFAFIAIAQLLMAAGHISSTVTRKVVHIGVAHWWILAMLFFDQWEFAVVGPIAFIFINLASHLFRLFPAMERDQRNRNLGTVYFPVALLICVLATWAGPVELWVGGLAILILGWGDGLASLVGERRESGTFAVLGNTKSIAGTLTMLAASAVVAAVFALIFGLPEGSFGPAGEVAGALGTAGAGVLFVGTTALVATLTELATPFGLDNLTVPLVTMLFVHLV